MGLFGSKSKRQLNQENRSLANQHRKDQEEIANLRRINQRQKDLLLGSAVRDAEKDNIMKKTMSDGLRHGSPECGRQMVGRREYLREERGKKK